MSAPSRRRSHRCLTLLGLIGLLSAVDFGLTAWCMATQGMFEANPFVRALVDATGSLAALAAYKAVYTAIGLLGLGAARRSAFGETATWAMAIVMIGLTLQWVGYLDALGSLDPLSLQQLSGLVHL